MGKHPRQEREKACNYGPSASLIACQGYLGRPGLRFRPLRNAAHQQRFHSRCPAVPHHETAGIKSAGIAGGLKTQIRFLPDFLPEIKAYLYGIKAGNDMFPASFLP